MNNNNVQSPQVPFLRTSRAFPEDPADMPRELTKMYSDLAAVVNRRLIGIFQTYQTSTGAQYYSDNLNTQNPTPYRQSFRTVYTYGTLAAGATATIIHGVNGIVQVTVLYAEAITAGSVNGKYIPIPFVDPTLITNCVGISADDTKIYIVNGSTADNIVSLMVVFEYLLS